MKEREYNVMIKKKTNDQPPISVNNTDILETENDIMNHGKIDTPITNISHIY